MNFKSLRRILSTVLAVAVLVISTVVSASPAMADQTVDMGAGMQLAFAPKDLTVSPGETITFTMQAMGPHNVVFEGALEPISVKNMAFSAGETISVTIPNDAAAGTYNFFCEPHRGAGMAGTVTVQ